MPSHEYPLGTDSIGRCLASRLIIGIRTTLGAALLTGAITFIIGLVIGVAAGMSPAGIDAIFLIVIDAALAFPTLILALVIAGFLGGGLKNLIVGMSLTYWVEQARFARSVTRALIKKDFIRASRVAGASSFAIALRHIVPGILPKMLTIASLNMSGLIIGISSMSFIGLGVRPPLPELGALLLESRSFMQANPLFFTLLVLVLALLTASFQLLAERRY